MGDIDRVTRQWQCGNSARYHTDTAKPFIIATLIALSPRRCDLRTYKYSSMASPSQLDLTMTPPINLRGRRVKACNPCKIPTVSRVYDSTEAWQA